MDSVKFLESGLPDRINKRDRERKNVIEKRKEERQSLAVESEQSSYFQETFNASCKQIKDTLDSTPSASSSTLATIFDQINRDIQVLKTYLSQSKIFLKVYDIRKAQENLQMLENEASELEGKLLPKKKFGFKNRRTVKIIPEKTSDAVDGMKDLNVSEVIINGTSKSSNKFSKKYGDNTCMLLNKVNENLILDAENVNKNDIVLSDLIGCTVKIYGTPSTLHVLNLKRCTVLVGPVTSSVFVRECNKCIFAFACQQLRLHSSLDCTIYLHVTSRAIIEDCTRIDVAPYNWSYPDQTSHFNLAGLDTKVNNWNCIDDFNWLSSEKHSPNWSVLESDLRVKNWD